MTFTTLTSNVRKIIYQPNVSIINNSLTGKIRLYNLAILKIVKHKWHVSNDSTDVSTEPSTNAN